MRAALRPALGLLVAAHLVLLILLAWGGEDPRGPRRSVHRGADFLQFWAGGTLLSDGRAPELYDSDAFGEPQRKLVRRRPYPPVYPPPLYQAGQALTPLGYSNAARVWILTSPLLWALGMALLLGAGPPEASRLRSVSLALALVSPVLIMNSLTGQTAGVWLFLFAASVRLWRAKRSVAAGVTLGLICAKPGLAAPLLLTLLLSGQLRVVAGFVLGGGLMTAFSAAIGGTTMWHRWVELMLEGSMVRKLGLVPARQFTARNFFGYPFRRTSLEDAATLIAVAAAVGLIAWFAARAWRTKPDDPSAPLRLGALTSACLFASPHLIEYDLGMHAVGFLAGCAHLLSGRALHRRIGAVTTVAFFLSPFLHPLSKELHFGLGAAVLLAWLLWLGAEVRGLGGAQAAGSTA